MSPYETFLGRARQAQAMLAEIRRQGGSQVALKAKPDSHVFRARLSKGARLSLRHFNQIIQSNAEERWIDVEGMISYHDLVNHLLPLNLIPKIVPELRSITVGGAISGVGIEATSFKHGLVHETVREMDILTGTGELLTCTRDNGHSELFYGMPNSYGVLGYVLRARVEVTPAKPFVQINHEKYTHAERAFECLRQASDDPANDFVEGVAFASRDIRVLVGKFVDGPTANYTMKDLRIRKPFYKAVRDDFGEVEYLTTRDFLWRWDADSYWATSGSILENKLVRMLFGRAILRSDRLLKILESSFFRFMRSNFRVKLEKEHKLTQDIGIPYQNWARYFEWYCTEIGRFPMWLCTSRASPVPLFQVAEGGLYCDFGTFSAGFQDRERYRLTLTKIEDKMLELGGIKCFYSDNALSAGDFYKVVNKDAYLALKRKYDPSGLFPDLYEKCVKVCGSPAVSPLL